MAQSHPSPSEEYRIAYRVYKNEIKLIFGMKSKLNIKEIKATFIDIIVKYSLLIEYRLHEISNYKVPSSSD